MKATDPKTLQKTENKRAQKLFEQRKTIARKQEEIDRLKESNKNLRIKIDELAAYIEQCK